MKVRRKGNGEAGGKVNKEEREENGGLWRG